MRARARAVRALKVTASSIVVLAVLELLARLVLPATYDARVELIDVAGADGIEALDRARMVARLRDASFRLFERDRELMWRVRPDLELDAHDLSLGEPRPWTVRTDASGFRIGAVSRADAPARLLAFGDSCTFGWGVEDGQTWPAVVSAERTTLDVRNRAVPGYSLVQGAALVVRESLRATDTIVLAFGANDGHHRLATDRDLIAQSRSWLGGVGFVLADSRLLSALQDVLYPLRAQRAIDRWHAGEAMPRVSPEDFGEELETIGTHAASVSAHVVLIDVCANDAYRDAMRAAAARHAWPLISYRDTSGETLDGCHPTPEGHQALGHAVAAAL